MKTAAEKEVKSIIGECLQLLETCEYYVQRQRPISMDQDYWDNKIDPDGHIRDIENERFARKEDVRYIAEWLNTLPAGRILDAGCGMGELLEQIDVCHEAHGIDCSYRSVEICRKHTRALVWQCDVAHVRFPNSYFDSVVAHHVIEHLDEPVAFVREMRRILKRNGKFVVGTPDFSCAAARRFGDRFRLLDDVTHVSLFIEDSLLRLLRDEGFIVEWIEKPFFGTRFATADAYVKMLAGDGSMSPPFYGSFITVFARKDDEI